MENQVDRGRRVDDQFRQSVYRWEWISRLMGLRYRDSKLLFKGICGTLIFRTMNEFDYVMNILFRVPPITRRHCHKISCVIVQKGDIT